MRTRGSVAKGCRSVHPYGSSSVTRSPGSKSKPDEATNETYRQPYGHASDKTILEGVEDAERCSNDDPVCDRLPESPMWSNSFGRTSRQGSALHRMWVTGIPSNCTPSAGGQRRHRHRPCSFCSLSTASIIPLLVGRSGPPPCGRHLCLVAVRPCSAFASSENKGDYACKKKAGRAACCSHDGASDCCVQSENRRSHESAAELPSRPCAASC